MMNLSLALSMMLAMIKILSLASSRMLPMIKYLSLGSSRILALLNNVLNCSAFFYCPGCTYENQILKILSHCQVVPNDILHTVKFFKSLQGIQFKKYTLP